MLEIVAPQLCAQVARSVDRGSRNKVGEKRRLQARVEQRKSCGEHAGVGLDAAHQNTARPQGDQVVDRSRGRQLSMLHKNPVGGDETVVGCAGSPAQLALERRPFSSWRSIVATDGMVPMSALMPATSHAGGAKLGWTSMIMSAGLEDLWLSFARRDQSMVRRPIPRRP